MRARRPRPRRARPRPPSRRPNQASEPLLRHPRGHRQPGAAPRGAPAAARSGSRRARGRAAGSPNSQTLNSKLNRPLLCPPSLPPSPSPPPPRRPRRPGVAPRDARLCDHGRRAGDDAEPVWRERREPGHPDGARRVSPASPRVQLLLDQTVENDKNLKPKPTNQPTTPRANCRYLAPVACNKFFSFGARSGFARARAFALFSFPPLTARPPSPRPRAADWFIVRRGAAAPPPRGAHSKPRM